MTKFESCDGTYMKLADSNIDNNSLTINSLVGADFYWGIVLEGFVKGKFGPVA